MAWYGDTVVDLRNALEELRVADREAAGIEGELEVNWQSMVKYVSDFGWRKPNRGRIRGADLRQTIEDLEMICARAQGAADIDRPLPSFRPPPPQGLEGRGWTVPTRHARKLHAALLRTHARRCWLRDAFETWCEADSTIEPLSNIATFEGSHRKRITVFQGQVPSYVARATMMAAVFLAVAVFALRSALR